MDLQMESPNPAPWAKESTFSNRSNIIPSFRGNTASSIGNTDSYAVCVHFVAHFDMSLHGVFSAFDMKLFSICLMRIGSCSIWPGAAGYLAKSFTPAGTFRSYSVILSSMSSAGLNHSEWSSMCPASILERSRTSLISLSNSWLLWFIKEMYCSLSCSFPRSAAGWRNR